MTKEYNSPVDLKSTPTQCLVRGRLFQLQNAKGNFGEIFEVYDKKNATKICQSYIEENIKKTKNYIEAIKDKEELEEEKKICEMAIEEIKKTIVWEIKTNNQGKLIKVKIGKYKE